jgi:hypothetical protein
MRVFVGKIGGQYWDFYGENALGTGERCAHAVEAGLDGVRKTLHRQDRAETYQGSYQCILNEVLPRILDYDLLDELLHVDVLYVLYFPRASDKYLPRINSILCHLEDLRNDQKVARASRSLAWQPHFCAHGTAGAWRRRIETCLTRDLPSEG